jgi:hypothetical protein
MNKAPYNTSTFITRLVAMIAAGLSSKETIMIRITRIRRLVGTLAALACTLAGLAIAAPAAFAMPVPIDGFKYTAPAIAPQTVTPVIVIGGMPGWQIASIAAGAAVLAAVLAVLAYRALIAHRSTAPSLA